MSQYNEKLARTDKQLTKMKDLANRGVCMFCIDHIHKEAPGTVESETKYWAIKANDFPYDHTKLHLLIIPKRHVSDIGQLNKAEKAEFLEAIANVAKRHSLKSYTVAVRSGDMHYNGGTIEHLHAHLVVGNTDDPNHEPVRFKMSSRPD